MDFALSIIGVAFGAFCVWLTVRFINRRERWVARTLAVIGLPALYVLSFGPACWLVDRGHLAARPSAVVYSPVLKLIRSDDDSKCAMLMQRYAEIGAAYDAGWTMTRILDAADLIGFRTGVWPRDMRHGTPHRSNDVRL